MSRVRLCEGVVLHPPEQQRRVSRDESKSDARSETLQSTVPWTCRGRVVGVSWAWTCYRLAISEAASWWASG